MMMMILNYFSLMVFVFSDFFCLQVRKMLTEGKQLTKPVNCPDKIHWIMDRCWLQKPTNRLDFDAILEGLNEVRQALKFN